MNLKPIAVIARRPLTAGLVMRTVAPLVHAGAAVELFVLGPAPPPVDSEETECLNQCARLGIRLFTDGPASNPLIKTLDARQMGNRIENADLMMPL